MIHYLKRLGGCLLTGISWMLFLVVSLLFLMALTCPQSVPHARQE